MNKDFLTETEESSVNGGSIRIRQVPIKDADTSTLAKTNVVTGEKIRIHDCTLLEDELNNISGGTGEASRDMDTLAEMVEKMKDAADKVTKVTSEYNAGATGAAAQVK